MIKGSMPTCGGKTSLHNYKELHNSKCCLPSGQIQLSIIDVLKDCALP